MGRSEEDEPLHMGELAKMTTMQEHLTQQQDSAVNHVDSVLSAFEYHGRVMANMDWGTPQGF